MSAVTVKAVWGNWVPSGLHKPAPPKGWRGIVTDAGAYWLVPAAGYKEWSIQAAVYGVKLYELPAEAVAWEDCPDTEQPVAVYEMEYQASVAAANLGGEAVGFRVRRGSEWLRANGFFA